MKPPKSQRHKKCVCEAQNERTNDTQARAQSKQTARGANPENQVLLFGSYIISTFITNVPESEAHEGPFSEENVQITAHRDTVQLI